MDNDIFIPYKFRASQIVGIVKVAVQAIETEGIRLGESKSAAGLSPNKISWVEKATQKIQEYITGSFVEGPNGPTSILSILANRTAEGEPEALQRAVGAVLVQASAQARSAFLRVEAIKAGLSQVFAGGGTQESERTIIDSAQKSNFLQLMTQKEPLSQRFFAQKRKVCIGWISGVGGIDLGEGFTVTHPEVGVYLITFEEPFTVGPVVSGSDRQGTQRTFSHAVLSASKIQVNMSTSTGAKENIAFSFMAIG